MVLQEQAAQTEQLTNQDRKYIGLTRKNMLKFLSSLILPLMLGIFTVVITFEQQKVGRQQRLEDQQLARLQRLEDKNESRLQREQDKNESRLQREQDKNESRLQREQEWNISQIALAAQSNAIADRYRDEVLISYIKEIADLLKENDGSLTSDPLTAILARAETLNTIQQLDGSRQPHVIRFLYEAKQLSNVDERTALDISSAELTDIDFHKSAFILGNGKISLAGVSLINCTLSDIQLTTINFSSAVLDIINFSSANLDKVNFASAQLFNVKFSSAELYDINFSSAVLYDINFLSAGLDNVNFSYAELYEVNFSSAKPTNVTFTSAYLVNVNFSSARFSEND
jgi:uncharacterized protein YjbI with pentapeptide repeats